MEQTGPTLQARLATLDELIQNVIPLFLAPVPSKDTLREWFANIPRFKTNPASKRGGGRVYYSVPHVEKYLRCRVLPGKVVLA